MHVLIAFILIVGLYSGITSQHTPPPEEVNLAVAGNPQVRLRAAVTPRSEMENDHLVKQMYDYSCGSAALATLLNFHLGEELGERQVIQGLLKYGDPQKIAQRRAFSLLDMKRFVAALGYAGAGYKAEMEDLDTLEAPCLLPIQLFGYRHFAVFRGIYKEHVFLADPWRGNISFTRRDFAGKWYRNVIFMVTAADREPVGLLRLSEADLRFIDEDMGRKMAFDPAFASKLPIDLMLEEMNRGYELYHP
jgi:predicted double-glycine peptidase